MSNKCSNRAVTIAVVCVVVAVLACGPTPASAGPSITITSPASGAGATVGQPVDVVSLAVADAGVARIELSVNGQTVRSDSPPSGNPTTFSVSQAWTPAVAGDATVAVVVYDTAGTASAPAVITLRVGAAAGDVPPGDEPTVAPADEPTATPEPDVVGAGGCTLNAAYAADVTVPDDTPFQPGDAFVKTWRIRNSGSCDWGAGFNLVFVSGEQMGAPASVPVPPTASGSTVEVSVNMTAPGTPGTYRSNWRVQSNTGTVFGSTVYVRIVVPEPATATPTAEPDAPTTTPTLEPDAPTATPTPEPDAPTATATRLPARPTNTPSPQPPTEHTVTLTQINAESGSVRSDGVVNTVRNVGDTVTNLGLQAFLSYDISGIPANATILNVVVDCTDYTIYGTPLGGLGNDGCLRAYMANYGTLDGGDYFDRPPMNSIAVWCSIAQLNNASSYSQAIGPLQGRLGNPRFQLRFQFNPPPTNDNDVFDAVQIQNCRLIVTYSTP